MFPKFIRSRVYSEYQNELIKIISIWLITLNLPNIKDYIVKVTRVRGNPDKYLADFWSAKNR